jgi:hypothetical protein
MTNMEKLYAALDRRVNPPKCHCDKVVVLQDPSKDKLFTPFYRCDQRDNVGIPSMILFSEVICVIHIITLATLSFSGRFPSLWLWGVHLWTQIALAFWEWDYRVCNWE